MEEASDVLRRCTVAATGSGCGHYIRGYSTTSKIRNEQRFPSYDRRCEHEHDGPDCDPQHMRRFTHGVSCFVLTGVVFGSLSSGGLPEGENATAKQGLERRRWHRKAAPTVCTYIQFAAVC